MCFVVSMVSCKILDHCSWARRRTVRRQTNPPCKTALIDTLAAIPAPSYTPQIQSPAHATHQLPAPPVALGRSEEHTSELQSPCNLVCRLLLEKKNHPRVRQGQPCPPSHEGAAERHAACRVQAHIALRL